MSDDKTTGSGSGTEVLGVQVLPGKPEAPDDWRAKLGDRKARLRYLETGERYWYSKEWYGSEKRRNPA